MTQLSKSIFRVRAAFVAALFATAVMACEGQPDDVWSPEPGTEPILHSLGTPTSFDVGPSAGDSAGSFAAARGSSPAASAELVVGIEGGTLELWAPGDQVLVITGLEVAVAPIALDGTVVPPEGATLTGVVARAAGPVSLSVNPGIDRITAISHLDLRVSWALERDGQVFPLSDLMLRRVPFSLEVSRNVLGQLRVRLVAFRDGIFWSWAGAMALADLTVDLVASETL
ncbi:MAG TPA: hypothetical protein VML75_23365 [Kofleriaceae bacterium]|nr:hypothetical protein [Kofleriaceae bacterium]